MQLIFKITAITVILLYTFPTPAEPPTTKQALTERVLGDQNAPVTIVEYSSFTCSHCGHFHTETLPKLKKKFIDTGKVKLIFREFLFDKLGLYATVMARCAEPKHYFAFVDVLFKQRKNWTQASDPVSALTRIGKLGGVSPSDFNACLKNQTLIDGILERQLEGQNKYDVKATPTFIIDGDFKIVGSEPYRNFEKILSKKLK